MIRSAAIFRNQGDLGCMTDLSRPRVARAIGIDCCCAHCDGGSLPCLRPPAARACLFILAPSTREVADRNAPFPPGGASFFELTLNAAEHLAAPAAPSATTTAFRPAYSPPGRTRSHAE